MVSIEASLYDTWFNQVTAIERFKTKIITTDGIIREKIGQREIVDLVDDSTDDVREATNNDQVVYELCSGMLSESVEKANDGNKVNAANVDKKPNKANATLCGLCDQCGKILQARAVKEHMKSH